jgi:hypothetical protein
MKNNINLKFIILLMLLPLILITINPLLLTIFDESYLRYIIKHTTFYFDIVDHWDLVGVHLEDAAQDAADEAAEQEAETLNAEQLLQDLSGILGLTVEHLSNLLAVENLNVSSNLNEITETSTSSPNTVHNELNTNNDSNSQNSNSDIDMTSNSSADSDPDSDVSIKSNSDSDSDSDSDMDVNSSTSESIIPFLLILIHQNILTKLNKVKTKWIKLVTTPIIVGTVKRGRQSNILKYIKYLSIFLTFIYLILLSLLFYPSLLENISLNYLLLNLTNIIDYITNHLYSLFNYFRELYNIFNFTDNTSKTLTPDTKLINDYNDNNEIIDNKDITDSKPFYKTKSFIIFCTIIVFSTLIYFYFHDLLPFTSEYNIYDTQRIDHLLDIISQKESQYNTLRVEHLKLLEQKNSLMEAQSKYLELIGNIEVIREGLRQNLDNIEFIEDHVEYLALREYLF